MPYQPLNRFSAHADLTQLSPPAIAIGKEIAYRTNGTRMKLSVSYLSEQTGYSQPTTNKAINELIDKGFFSATQANRRAARVFTLLVACPDDCKQVKNHYSPAEKKALAALENTPAPMAEYVNSDPLSVELSDPEYVSSFHTNKELNKEIKKNLNTKEISQVTELLSDHSESVLVSLSQWVNVCSNTISKLTKRELSAAHTELSIDPQKYHSNALAFLATKENIDKPLNYLASVIRKNPAEFMATATNEQKTIQQLRTYLGNTFNNSEWKEQYTREPLHNYQALTNDLLATYGAEWLPMFSEHNALSDVAITKAARQLLTDNPSAYKPLPAIEPANAY